MMRMLFRYARLAAVNLASLGCMLFLTACPTPPKAAPHITHLEPVGGGAPIIPPVDVEAAPAPVVSAPVVPPPAQIQEKPPAPVVEEAPKLPAGMLPVSTWAQLCGFDSVKVIPNSNPQAVALDSEAGKLTFYLGQRFAKWNGINIGLGFTPVGRRGQLTVNSIDVLKNVYPLGKERLAVKKENRVVVIDPGHGGADPGSRSAARNIYEKDLTLDWALRMERLLTNSNWRVVLTRRDDRDIPLMDRVAIADQNNADLFISLHFNSLEKNGSTPDETGVETYCLTPVGAPSNISRNFEDDLRHVYPNNEFDGQNILLATRIQSNLVRASGRRDRGVRRARFMTVVREQRRPAVLIEGGFLSNPGEAALIVQPGFRERIAQAVCKALPD
jgi:N-acetylmuramoyl-L-alanine amidase